MASPDKMRVAIVATHPIQYQVPWYRLLAAQPHIELKVFYAMIPDEHQQGVGFGVPFQWDIPMLEGYDWQVLKNEARHPGIGSFFSCNVPTVGRELKRFGAEAAVITGWQSFFLVQALWHSMRAGIPRLARGESTLQKKRKPWVRLSHRMFLRQYDAFLAIGRANRAFYTRCAIPSNRVFDCPYFADNKFFRDRHVELENDRIQIRRSLAIPEGRVCFLYVGKLQAIKRPLDVISALAEARKQVANIHLLVIGTGELLGEAERLAAKLNGSISLGGFLNQAEIVSAYTAGDCLVLPGLETWGVVVNEAMACGRPAIVSDRVGCGPDLVKDGVTGFVFPYGDVGALARKMVQMASDPEKMRRMGRNAQELVLEHYSVEKAVEGTLKALEFVVKRKKRKGSGQGRG